MFGSRTLTFRYVGALLAIASLLVAGQLLVQRALEHQKGDARVVNMAGRQRMSSQRLCMLLLADARGDELEKVVDEWERNHHALRDRESSDAVRHLFDGIADDHRAMVAAARQAIAGGDRASAAHIALAHQDAFLDGIDRIVAEYEHEARARVLQLRRIELLLLGIALLVLALEGMFVFRPAVRALRRHLAERDAGERKLVEVSDREQQRIAQDLHDGICQQLVGVSFLVKAMREPTPERIAEIETLLRDAIAHTRNLARGLHSHTLEMDGLPAALRELAAQTERIYGVPCRTHLDEVAEGVEVRTHLYNIAREAIANAGKHARATAIDVELRRTSGTLVLAVRDDGVGIGPTSPAGMGLHMMEQRAKMLGAVLVVAPGDPRGTVVTCTLPGDR